MLVRCPALAQLVIASLERVLIVLDDASDIEEDMLDKAWGLEQTSRLSCQAVPPIDEEIEIELPKYNINMVSEDH